MRIIVTTNGQHRDVLVQVDESSATVESLCAATGISPLPGTDTIAGIDVDGRFVPATTPLRDAGLHDGAVVEAAAPHGPAWGPRPVAVWVTVVAGTDTGRRVALVPNRSIVIGRDPTCDLVLSSSSISNRHALITMTGDGTVTVTDTDSRNGTWIDGTSIHEETSVEVDSTVRVGAVVVAIQPPDDHDLPTSELVPHDLGATIPFNRPPRPAPPPRPTPLTIPRRPESTVRAKGFRIAALVSPILMGAFMVARTGGDIRYAGFAIISPIAFFFTWISDKRRAKKEARSHDSSFGQSLERFTEQLGDAWQAARRRPEHQAPAMAEVMRRSMAPSTRLWERRLGHPDALRLRVGSADVEWRPPLVDTTKPRTSTPAGDDAGPGGATPEQGTGNDELPEDVTAALAARDSLPQSPVTIDLVARAPGSGAGGFGGLGAGMGGQGSANGQHGVVGIVGDGDGPRALARALLLQATTFHGPADLQVGVFTSQRHASGWEWSKWLPHARLPDGRTRMVGDREAVSQQLAEAMLDARTEVLDATRRSSGRVVDNLPFLVVDDLSLLAGRAAPARRLLAGDAGPVAGIVVAATVDQLPASCSIVVVVGQDGVVAQVHWPARGRHLSEVITAGVSVEDATTTARAMARWDDPELAAAGGQIPDLVRLLPLLEMDQVDAATVAARWAANDVDPGAPATLGADGHGPVTLELRTDGPHGLVGGTTGSGKSELLRSMIASMAAQVDPDHLVFVLVDYKGGSAFDTCAELPHTVGMVTDLDEHLGQRALVSLEAELHHRELVLRDAGVQDLPEYLASGSPAGPMPRLVVVIDEFATMATELPDFLGALVGIAQRGRSLGVHLILATQRPRGAVDGNVRANTNLRIALRVQDPGDSTDIIDVPDAADLPRDRPGRAWIRRGHGDLVLVQSALSTAGAPSSSDPLRVAPFRFTPTTPLPNPVLSGTSDLDRLVAACQTAFIQSGATAPRRPWLPMPEERIQLVDLLADPRAEDVQVTIGMEDVPESQAQIPAGWDFRDGHLSLIGAVGQGTTTALLSVATSIAMNHSPERVHLHGIDFGGGGLAALAALPHTGAIVDSGTTERQARLVTMLADEMSTRRTLTSAQRAELPRIVVLIDKFAGFLAEHDTIESRSISESFQRVFKEGPAVGIVMAVTGEQHRDIPSRLSSAVAMSLLFKTAEGGSGLQRPRGMPNLSPGRSWNQASEHVVQIGLPPDPATLVDRWDPPVDHIPDPVETIPAKVSMDRIRATRSSGGSLRIPVGLTAKDLGIAHLEVHPGDHVTIAGPPRSGKSSLLQVLSSQLRLMLPDAVQLAVCDPARSPLAGWQSLDGNGTVDQLAPYLELGSNAGGHWFILVDDAGQVAESRMIADLLAIRPNLHVIAAGRTSDMRGTFGSWIRTARTSRTGILLQPDLPGDGDLLSTKLPRRITTPLVTGRGWVVSGGDGELAQMALPPTSPPPGGLASPTP